MSNTLKVALVQEIGDRHTQRSAFVAFNNEMRTDAARVAHVLTGGRPVEEKDAHIAEVIDTVLAETNTGSQLGFGTEEEAAKTTSTLGCGEWAWGEVFADTDHAKARHEYGRLALQLQVAEREAAQINDPDGGSNEALLELAAATEAAKRQRALAALRVVATLNAVEQVATSELDEASILALNPIAQLETPVLGAAA